MACETVAVLRYSSTFVFASLYMGGIVNTLPHPSLLITFRTSTLPSIIYENFHDVIYLYSLSLLLVNDLFTTFLHVVFCDYVPLFDNTPTISCLTGIFVTFYNDPTAKD